MRLPTRGEQARGLVATGGGVVEVRQYGPYDWNPSRNRRTNKMNAKASRNTNATATSTQKTPVEHPFFLSGCREGESDSGGISSLIVFYA